MFLQMFVNKGDPMVLSLVLSKALSKVLSGGVPPARIGVLPQGQESEFLLHGRRYAPGDHSRGLSCFAEFSN